MPRVPNLPPEPSARQIAEHELAGHAVYRSWCRHCVASTGRAREDARLRPISTSANSTSDNSTSASWPKSNWPKSKLAEVEIGRSRTDGVCSVSSFSLSFFSYCFVFTFLHFFLVFTHLSLHFVSVLCFRPQKPELNPKPRTLHPISDGPFRWTPLQ